jgi:ribonuclease P protein component
MVSKKFRFPIRLIRKKPFQIIKTDFFLLKIYKNNLNINRFGVITSLKVDKKATVRNLLKRRIISIVKNFPNQSQDFLISVFPKAKTLNYNELQENLRNLFNLNK